MGNAVKNKRVTTSANNGVIEFPEVWMKNLKTTPTGIIKNNIPNYILILENDKELKGKLRLNEHSKRVEVKDACRFS